MAANDGDHRIEELFPGIPNPRGTGAGGSVPNPVTARPHDDGSTAGSRNPYGDNGPPRNEVNQPSQPYDRHPIAGVDGIGATGAGQGAVRGPAHPNAGK
jgi:hypothetical protein